MRLTAFFMSLALLSGKARADDTVAAPATGATALRPQFDGQYATGISLHEWKDKGRRASISTSFEGPVTLEAAHHRLRTLVLDRSATNATSFLVSKTFALTEEWSATGELGYFSPGSEHLFGSAIAAYSVSGLCKMSGGYQRAPLALEVPLARPDQGVMRETAFIAIDWEDWLSLRSAVKRDDTYAAYEEHQVVGRLALFKGERPGDALYATFPVAMEVHPKPSPFYRADPRVTRLGFGFDYSRDMGAPWVAKAGTEYQLINIMPRGRNGQSRRAGRLQVSGEWASKRRRGWEFYAKGLYARAEEEEDFRLDDLSSYFSLGFRYTT